jgi:hypothetical protein
LAAQELTTRAQPCLMKWRVERPDLLGGHVIVTLVATAQPPRASLRVADLQASITLHEAGLTACVREAVDGARPSFGASLPAPLTLSFPLFL